MQGFQIFQYDFKKKFFSSFNDKVFMCDDLSCRPLGHWKNVNYLNELD